MLFIDETKYAHASTISISSQSFTISSGHYKTLYVNGSNSKVIWSTSDNAVATVSSYGRVIAKSPGKATIYAYVSGKKLYSKVTVIKLNATSITLESGKTKTLKVYGTSSKVTWTSSNKMIATVANGGKVIAKTTGTATVNTYVSGKKLSCKVTVIKLNTSSATLAVGTANTLKVYGISSSSVIWSSSDKTVATVSSDGKVSAKKAGTATITADVSKVKLHSKVTVNSAKGTTAREPDSILKTTEVTTSSLGNIPRQSTKIIGYYAAWSRYSGYTADKIDAMKITNINYAFANIGSDLKITLGYPDIDPDNISKLNQLKLINPKLKTIISVGGWSWSGRFSDVALTEETRSTFADSCVDFIIKYGFDGVDIDWEYPVSGGLITNVRRPEDKYNFTLLLETLRKKLDARGIIDGKKYVLTFAGAAGSWYTRNTELRKISQYVDYANIMTYDIHGTWEAYTNFNAPLYCNDPLQPYKISVDSSIQNWLKVGFPKDKLVMGVPFYGFIYNAVAINNFGLYQTYYGGASISYANIAKNYLSALGYIRYYHSDSRVPWLFNGSTFITYEDEQSIAEKARYIETNSLGGVMIWELSQDPNIVLLNALYKELSQ